MLNVKVTWFFAVVIAVTSQLAVAQLVQLDTVVAIVDGGRGRRVGRCCAGIRTDAPLRHGVGAGDHPPISPDLAR